ncbi:MAG: tRNA 2-thiocytidine(32) synthetase TtcA [Clostridia bacterium]|nr:tRNA 2-thiocytidine(32) synthetase TtcA [Clostridia bacterium]
MEKLLSPVRRACEHYGMIEAGDLIVVGLSGGKDSMALLYALAAMRRFYPVPYELAGVCIDLGFPDTDGLFAPLEAFCRTLGVSCRIEKTEIAPIVFEGKREKNPCSLCAKMRRGALTDAVREMGGTKLALGHHLDDAAETFLLSLFEDGRIGSFSPVTVYEDRGISVIRPLVYAREYEISALVRAAGLPVVKSPCPEDGNTARAEMRELMKTLGKTHRGLPEKLIGALERRGIDGWSDKPVSPPDGNCP